MDKNRRKMEWITFLASVPKGFILASITVVVVSS